ncbi:MAG: DUF421 domain-containing protein [Actinobacteria bacterium]|nr:MAG: DUF421 domain-containing protein [Actinomycetota bacterium]
MDIVLRAIVLYAFVVFVMRVIGRRELSSMTPFDLVLLIVLGDAIQQGLTQDDYSVTGAVLAIATIASLQVLTSYLSYRSRRARKVFEGQPLVLVERGELVGHNLRRERMTPDDVAEEMRQQQISSLDDVEWGILEANGSISFIKKN